MILFEHSAGVNDEFIDFQSLKVPVHVELLKPLQELEKAAGLAGIQLGFCSGYRSFERQLQIWNDKATGKRPLYDQSGNPVEVSQLDDELVMKTILLWSALPGASRHHWGTEVDVVDAGCVASGYEPKLLVTEYEEQGEFCVLGNWLNDYFSSKSPIFFRPYTRQFKAGVSPEPWHLSYRPLAENYAKACDLNKLRSLLESSDIALKDCVLTNLNWIYENFVARYFYAVDF